MSLRDKRHLLIARWQAGITVSTDDRDLIDAMFLHKHPGWKPEDLGYPAGDYIIVDLLRALQ